ncbi:Hypothetical_protein [Hexamita inflata]|uniref:Hypothetical_protein n=1 Tax=Hexamita inflata TaxID=28002 RepID=A0AA86S4Y4_9EUKA|nr:Hypothetical protein HINF_LOCUS481 [Hexamita inflata]CAI9922205.1 Hypothetical protein HINF_LOCUS9850 [Hexamita inflata]CAI9978110.1 Hypothetical protein HINF_LOCUS65755 [Hexamita inflata]
MKQAPSKQSKIPVTQKSRSPQKDRSMIARPPTQHEFKTPAPDRYFPDVNMDTTKEFVTKSRSPIQKETDVPILPYMIGYRALYKKCGTSMGARCTIDFQAREQAGVPSSHNYTISSPLGKTRQSTLHVKPKYQGLIIPDNF